METVYIGEAAPKGLIIPIKENIAHGDQANALDSVKVSTQSAPSDAGMISRSISEVSRARKIEQYKEDTQEIGQMKSDSRTGRFVNVVKINNSMNCLVTVSLGLHHIKLPVKDPDTGSNSSGIDTDPDKSDSEGENSSYSSIGTQSSNCDEDIGLSKNFQKLNFDESGCAKEVFYVREYEGDQSCDDFKDTSVDNHRAELNKIMSVRGTVRGVKNRVRAGIETFLQQEEQIVSIYFYPFLLTSRHERFMSASIILYELLEGLEGWII